MAATLFVLELLSDRTQVINEFFVDIIAWRSVLFVITQIRNRTILTLIWLNVLDIVIWHYIIVIVEVIWSLVKILNIMSL